MTIDSTSPRRDPYAVLRVRDFRLVIIGRLLSSLGGEMLFPSRAVISPTNTTGGGS